MSIIIRLQNLPWSANSVDIRRFFSGQSIPEGGVHIVGGEMGDAFIAFSTDEDARLAMAKDGGKIKDMQIKLLLSSRTEMMRVIEQARQQNMVVSQPQMVVPQPQMVASQPQMVASQPQMVASQPQMVVPQPAILSLQQPARIIVPSPEPERRRGRSPSPHRRSRDRSPARDRRRSPDERRGSKRDRSGSPSRSSRSFSGDMDRRSDRFRREDRRYDDSRYRDERRSTRDPPQEPKKYLDADHVHSRSQLHATEGFRNMQPVYEQTSNVAIPGSYPYGNDQFSAAKTFPETYAHASSNSPAQLPQVEHIAPHKPVGFPPTSDQKQSSSTAYPQEQMPFRGSPFESSVTPKEVTVVPAVEQQIPKPRRPSRFEPAFVPLSAPSQFTTDTKPSIKNPVENQESSYNGVKQMTGNYPEVRNTWLAEQTERSENTTWNEKRPGLLNPPVSKNGDFLQVVPMDLDPSPEMTPEKEIYHENLPPRGPPSYIRSNASPRNDNLQRDNQNRGHDNNKGPMLHNRGPIQHSDNRGLIQHTDSRGTLQHSDNRGPIQHNDNRISMQYSDNRAPLQHSDNRGLIQHSDNRGSIQHSDNRGPIQHTDNRGPIQHSDNRGPIQHSNRGPIQHSDNRGPIQHGDNRGPIQHGDNRGPIQHGDNRGPIQHGDNRGPIQHGDNRGLMQHGDNRGLIKDSDNRGLIHSDNRGPVQHSDNRGSIQHSDKRGPPVHNDTQGRIAPSTLTVEVRGLPPDARIDDILDLFHGIPLPAANIRIEASDQGFEKAFIRFVSISDFEEAMNRNRHFMHEGRCELIPCPAASFDSAPRSQKPKPKPKPRDDDLTVQLRGLPFSCKDDDIVRFFDGLGILDLYVDIAPDGRATGTGFVEFGTPEDFRSALAMNGKMIGHRYITVSVASKEMMAFVRGEEYNPKSQDMGPRFPNNSCPPRPNANQGRPLPNQMRPPGPLINQGRQAPPVPTRPPPCISMKGLPEGVSNRDIADFLGQMGIMPRAVHIMLRPDKTPSGDAFAEFGGPADMETALQLNGKPMMGKRVSVQPILFHEMLEILGRPNPIPPPATPSALLRTPGDMERPRRPLLPQGPVDASFRERPRMEHPNRGSRPLLMESGRPYNSGRMRGPWPNRSFNSANRPDGRFPPPSAERGLKDFGSPGCVVSINNLHFRAGLEELLDFFCDYKISKDSIIRKYNENGQTTGEARISFQNPRDAQRAVRELNQKPIMGRSLSLSIL